MPRQVEEPNSSHALRRISPESYPLFRPETDSPNHDGFTVSECLPVR
jgi:hypothetical protein